MRAKRHPDYEDDDGYVYPGRKKSAATLEQIFALDFDAAHRKHMASYMKKDLAAFKKTKAWREAE